MGAPNKEGFARSLSNDATVALSPRWLSVKCAPPSCSAKRPLLTTVRRALPFALPAPTRVTGRSHEGLSACWSKAQRPPRSTTWLSRPSRRRCIARSLRTSWTTRSPAVAPPLSRTASRDRVSRLRCSFTSWRTEFALGCCRVQRCTSLSSCPRAARFRFGPLRCALSPACVSPHCVTLPLPGRWSLANRAAPRRHAAATPPRARRFSRSHRASHSRSVARASMRGAAVQ
jgi:hypothetical protein